MAGLLNFNREVEMEPKTAVADVASAIQEMMEPWNRAVIDEDWDAALAMCTKDIVFLPQGSEPVVGPDAIRAWSDEQPPIKTMTWSVDHLEQEGDMAWLRGPVHQVLETEDGEVEFDGKFADLMRRGQDGRWRFASIMWSSNHEE